MSKMNTDDSKQALEKNPDKVVDTEKVIPGTSAMVGSQLSRRPKRFSQSVRAGLKMPVGKIHKNLKKGKYAPRVGPAAAVCLAAVLEYVTAEVLELAAQAAKEHRKVRIAPHHLLLAIRNDIELDQMLGKTIMATGDVSNHQSKRKPVPKKTGRRNKRSVRRY